MWNYDKLFWNWLLVSHLEPFWDKTMTYVETKSGWK